MKTVYIYCEGQTEESFINEILYPYFFNMDIYVQPIVHKTKITTTKTYRGGVSNYNDIKSRLIKLCSNRNAIVTTMFDYYGMPSDTPSIHYKDTDIFNKIEHIEQEITKDIGFTNLFFNLTLHEFEGLLFSNPQSFSRIADDKVVNKLQSMRDNADSPEHINNGINTAPSKRIENLLNNYSKIRQGMIVAKDIGIDKILSECKHFSDWIEKIKKI